MLPRHQSMLVFFHTITAHFVMTLLAFGENPVLTVPSLSVSSHHVLPCRHGFDFLFFFFQNVITFLSSSFNNHSCLIRCLFWLIFFWLQWTKTTWASFGKQNSLRSVAKPTDRDWLGFIADQKQECNTYQKVSSSNFCRLYLFFSLKLNYLF